MLYFNKEREGFEPSVAVELCWAPEAVTLQVEADAAGGAPASCRAGIQAGIPTSLALSQPNAAVHEAGLAAGVHVEAQGLGCYGPDAGEAGGSEGAAGPGPLPGTWGGVGTPSQSSRAGEGFVALVLLGFGVSSFVQVHKECSHVRHDC